jgi:glycosyltransferase involved in cell wall biosynthesis
MDPRRGIRVAHLTTAHPPTDSRILSKEAVTLARAGYRVSVVAPGKHHMELEGVQVLPFLPPSSRAGRMTRGVVRAVRLGARTGADRYHLHDPELLLAAPVLRLLGKSVVFDAHEDLPRQILGKYWIPRRIRPLVGHIASLILGILSGGTSAVVAATPEVAKGFRRGATVVRNYPRLEEFEMPTAPSLDGFVYVGAVSEDRGAIEMVRAIAALADDARLHVAGSMVPAKTKSVLEREVGWQRVIYHGVVNRQEVARLLHGAAAGLVVLHPTPSYTDALPVKMFEYMAAGVPVIASDFPVLREIVEASGCGILVEPLDVHAISSAMQWVLDHPEEAGAMGRRGRETVRQKLNWEAEAVALLALYAELDARERRRRK